MSLRPALPLNALFAESLRVNVTIASEQGLLIGQTQALMIAGIAEFTSLRLRAAPGTYNLSVSLPDHPEVWPPTFAQHSAA